MKIANIELYSEGKLHHHTDFEEVRDFNKIIQTPLHVVFEMKDDTIVAYKADRVRALTTHIE